MEQWFFHTGRNAELSFAELHAALPQGTKFLKNGQEGALTESEVSLDPVSLQRKLGGTMRISLVLGSFATLPEATTAAEERLSTIEGKVTFGLNLLTGDERSLRTLLSKIKRSLKSARFVNHTFENLSTAQAYHAGLWHGKGVELSFLKVEENWLLLETKAGQDIESYSIRDYEKPVRDAKVGMLPPKLAQVMLNLAKAEPKSTIWDPFCGLGTVLLEGALMGHKMLGSDLEPRMVEASKTNFQWYTEIAPIALPKCEIWQHDAAKPIGEIPEFDTIVTEGYLGDPRSRLPSEREAEALDRFLSDLYGNFFMELRKKAKTGTPIVITIPVLRGERRQMYRMEKTLAKIESLGYRSAALLPNKEAILYERPDQIVCREVRKFILETRN